MTGYSEFRESVRTFLRVVRVELAWFPGRWSLVARVVSASAVVTVMALVFRIPGAALGAAFPILISRQHPKAARESALRIGLACSIAAAEVIVGNMLTAGSAFLHTMWVLVSLFLAFYAISRLNFDTASLTASAFLAVAIQVWDYPIPAETRLEHTLYTLLSILVGCAVAAAVENLFHENNSTEAIIREVDERLRMLGTLLTTLGVERPKDLFLAVQLRRSATKGLEVAWEQLQAADYDEEFREMLATVIGLTRQLVELGASLAESKTELTSEDRQRCLDVSASVVMVRAGLRNKQFSAQADVPAGNIGGNAILIEIERTVDLIAQSFSDADLRAHWSPVSTDRAKASDTVSDVFSHIEHLKFAIRGTLSSFVCYLFYMSTGWMGLGASILTCTLTARRFTGASRHRQSLRFAGFVIGAGIIGLGAEVIALPRLDDLVQFSLLIAAVVAAGAWMATSGPRIAFAGFQLVLAYDLVNLNKFNANTSLVPARDAILAVVLGVVAMWLVFDHLWAEDSGASVRSLLLGTLYLIGDLGISQNSSSMINQHLSARVAAINRNLDKLRELADLYVFEAYPKSRHESLVNRSVRTLLPELRAFLLLKHGLLQRRALSHASPRERLIQNAEIEASAMLHELASAIGTGSSERLAWQGRNLRDLIETINTNGRTPANVGERTLRAEINLCISLLDIAADLGVRTENNLMLDVRSIDPRQNNPVEA